MSQEYICHNCWQRNLLEKLQYRSLGHEEDIEVAHWARNPRDRGLRPMTELLGSPVRRAWQQVFREDFQGFQNRSQGRVVLYCPNCREPLSDRNVIHQNHTAFLGIFGPRYSGKTLFMIALIQELNRGQFDGKTLGLVGLGDSNDRLNQLSDQLKRGEKPDPSPREKGTPDRDSQQLTKIQRFAWQLQVADSELRRFSPALLSLYDVSGEDLKVRHDEDMPVLENYCRTVTSLIFLIDGKEVARDLGLPVKDAWDDDEQPASAVAADVDVLRNVRDRIGGPRSRTVDLALVLSKADYLWDQPGWEKLKPENGQPETEGFDRVMQSLLRDTKRNGLMAEATAGFRNVRFFSSSSLGFRPSNKDVKNGILTSTGKIKPRGVTDAVTWLLGRRLPMLRRPS